MFRFIEELIAWIFYVLVSTLNMCPPFRWSQSLPTGYWAWEFLSVRQHSDNFRTVKGDPQQAPTHFWTNRALWPNAVVIKITVISGRCNGLAIKNKWGRWLTYRLPRAHRIQEGDSTSFLMRVGREDCKVYALCDNNTRVRIEETARGVHEELRSMANFEV